MFMFDGNVFVDYDDGRPRWHTFWPADRTRNPCEVSIVTGVWVCGGAMTANRSWFGMFPSAIESPLPDDRSVHPRSLAASVPTFKRGFPVTSFQHAHDIYVLSRMLLAL